MSALTASRLFLFLAPITGVSLGFGFVLERELLIVRVVWETTAADNAVVTLTAGPMRHRRVGFHGFAKSANMNFNAIAATCFASLYIAPGGRAERFMRTTSQSSSTSS